MRDAPLVEAACFYRVWELSGDWHEEQKGNVQEVEAQKRALAFFYATLQFFIPLILISIVN